MKRKKDTPVVTLKLEASDSIISTYFVIQKLLKSIYLSCVLRKVSNIQWISDYGQDTKLYKIPLPVRCCFPTKGKIYRTSSGYIKYSQVPVVTYNTILWYAERDALTIIRYLNHIGKNIKLMKTRKDIYDIIHDPGFNRKLLLYNIDHCVIPIPAAKTILQQALYCKGLHKPGTFMLPVVKWDVPIAPDSLQWLKDHFPQITCKIINVYLYTGMDQDNHKSLCVMIRYINQFDPYNLNAVGQLIYRNPYVLVHPNRKTLYTRYPMLDKANGYRLEKPLDFYYKELYVMMDCHGCSELRAADLCAKRYQEERYYNKPQDSVSDEYGTEYLAIKPLKI